MLRRALVVQHPVGSAIERRREVWQLVSGFGWFTGKLVVAVSLFSLFCLFAAVVQGPRMGCESKTDSTRQTVATLAYQAYPAWAAANPTEVCPGQLSRVAEYVNAEGNTLRDAWGNPLRHFCERGLLVVSAGEDGVFDTTDDIRSRE